jgi:hypothetical protein
LSVVHCQLSWLVKKRERAEFVYWFNRKKAYLRALDAGSIEGMISAADAKYLGGMRR